MARPVFPPRAVLGTAGLPISETHTKNRFANEPEGLQQFQDRRWKALGKDNSDLPGTLLCDYFLTSYFLKHVKTWPEQKCTRQIWIRLVEYSSSEVSDPSDRARVYQQ